MCCSIQVHNQLIQLQNSQNKSEPNPNKNVSCLQKRRVITVYPHPNHYWRFVSKYYPILLNPLHNATLPHLPKAQTFTSGFTGLGQEGLRVEKS